MTARSIRRAAERQAKKLEAQSPARLEANRANAQLSTGPRSQQGKRTSSLNAVKTALTGVTVLLPTDDAAEYQRHIAAYEKEFQPVGIEESELVQSLADISWRLRRIPALEMAIYARGSVIYADQFEEEDPDVRRGLIELQTHLVYEKQLRNLQLQEARLVRRREKESAELRRLQKERAERSEITTNGFEFSNANRKPPTDEHFAPSPESATCPSSIPDLGSDKTAPARAA